MGSDKEEKNPMLENNTSNSSVAGTKDVRLFANTANPQEEQDHTVVDMNQAKPHNNSDAAAPGATPSVIIR